MDKGRPQNAVNYISTGDAIPSGGPKARFQDNIAALRLLQHLDATGQQALPDQQRGLARYVGWGGLSDAFDGKKAEWAGEYKTLKELLPAQEYEAARASTLTSFYTPPEMIRTMYETLQRFGLKGGNILEPSMGVGAFFANRPASFDTNGTMLYGVELDPVTGASPSSFFLKQTSRSRAMKRRRCRTAFFDAVVGNVPFGQYKVNDPAFNRYNFLIHDYFAAKNIDKLRVGGIQAIITTSGTMDKKKRGCAQVPGRPLRPDRRGAAAEYRIQSGGRHRSDRRHSVFAEAGRRTVEPGSRLAPCGPNRRRHTDEPVFHRPPGNGLR